MLKIKLEKTTFENAKAECSLVLLSIRILITLGSK